MTNSTSTPVVPSEVGWQFVPQYYTFVNKQPNRLHCFYTKSSTFIHGTEGEDGKPCYGQQEIHNKITSIGFQDCKVFIHSVDAQSSANGGIIIQVIGEMSNHGEPWRKFVQTFFLAEQPNGYFVLNDIFRFLKEETVESDDASETAETEQQPAPAPAAVPVAAAPEPAPAPAPPSPVPVPAAELPREPTPPPAPSPAPPSPAPEEAPSATTDFPEPPAIVQIPTPAPEPTKPAKPATPVPTSQPNGIHTPEPEKSIPAPAPAAAEKSPAPTPAPAAAPSPAPSAATPAPPVPAPAPTAPRSWASLAASNPRKWGSAVAQESRGVTETPAAPVPASSGTSTPPVTAATPPARGPPQHQQHHHQGGPGSAHPLYIAAQNVNITQCFVKGVIEPISQTLLTNVLTQRFGPVKDVEIVRSKACAFLEFTSVDAARRAITASLPQSVGGDGGIFVDVGGDAGTVRIAVETKKERGERPLSRPRGGAPVVVNGDREGGAGRGGRDGGSFRGRGGPGRGRGTPAGK